MVCAFQTELVAQRGNVWVFGDSSLIDFNNPNNPIPGHSAINSRGTSTSVCNSNGYLLFSSSYDPDILIAGVAGGEVYDHNNNLMQNGDNLKFGGWYYEAIIIPNPSYSNHYFIFHIGVTDYYGLYYTKIDMSLNNGLGEVTPKNIQVNNFKANDGLTAVKHGNGRDWWVIFRKASLSTSASNTFDLYDRKVIGWALSNRMFAKQTSIAALKMALNNRPIQANESLIFHSDRGIQYACDEFVKEISKHANIKRSMSRKGNCWDNAVAESFFKTLKVELVYHCKYKSREQAELSIFEYIETFYNTNRRHKQLNNLTIKEFNKLINNNLKNAA